MLENVTELEKRLLLLKDEIKEEVMIDKDQGVPGLSIKHAFSGGGDKTWC